MQFSVRPRKIAPPLQNKPVRKKKMLLRNNKKNIIMNKILYKDIKYPLMVWHAIKIN